MRETLDPVAHARYRGWAMTRFLPWLALTALGLLFGCGPHVEEPDTFQSRCDAFDGPAAAECMIRCAAAANPMSDEEGEDLVDMCATHCRELYCTVWARYYSWNGWRSCAVGPPEAKRRCDAHFGKGAKP